MTAAAVQVQDLRVSFGGAVALHDVSFQVEPQTVHAVIGPNGAGKSTLFNVLCGVYRPDHGRVLIDGVDVIGRKPAAIARLGVGRAFQNASMFDSLTVRDNLLVGRHRLMRSGVFGDGFRLRRTRTEERQSRAMVAQIAESLDLSDHVDRLAGELPYGLAKRVDLGRALASSPSVLLLDEPAAGGDPGDREVISAAIERIAHDLGTTVILVEHDMSLVMSVSDRVTVLNFGHVITTETPAAVRRDPAVIEAYLGGVVDRSQP